MNVISICIIIYVPLKLVTAFSFRRNLIGDQDQTINVVYQVVKIEDNDPSTVAIYHILKKVDGTTEPIPKMADRHLGGTIGETITIEPIQPKLVIFSSVKAVSNGHSHLA